MPSAHTKPTRWMCVEVAALHARLARIQREIAQLRRQEEDVLAQLRQCGERPEETT